MLADPDSVEVLLCPNEVVAPCESSRGLWYSKATIQRGRIFGGGSSITSPYTRVTQRAFLLPNFFYITLIQLANVGVESCCTINNNKRNVGKPNSHSEFCDGGTKVKETATTYCLIAILENA